MYVPKHFSMEESELVSFLKTFPFAILVSSGQYGLSATHLPLVVEQQERGLVLNGHMARANTQWRELEKTEEVMVIFQGPHAYISPDWYPENRDTVPTWNYVAVHAYGRPCMLDEARLYENMETLIQQFEKPAGWSTKNLSPDFYSKKIKAIVGFEIKVTRLEGKAKLSQNKKDEDRAGVAAALDNYTGENEKALAEMVRTGHWK